MMQGLHECLPWNLNQSQVHFYFLFGCISPGSYVPVYSPSLILPISSWRVLHWLPRALRCRH